MSAVASIPRTATFAWSHKGAHPSPLLATGTVSGALDESFTSQASLEVWEVWGDDEQEGSEEERCRARVNVNARFNRLAWSAPSDARPRGILAAGMDSGEVGLWDAERLLQGEEEGEEKAKAGASIFTTDRHRGSVRGLAWNALQPNLFASGATDAEIFIWDTKNLSKPYGPSANKSRHLTDITALAWNPSVAHILATASASGSTVVWDLKGRQEVIHLSYLGNQGSVYSQGPKPVSSICWHAERGTRVITASEDDGAPVVLVWDLRNYRTPERVLSGHDKGILSLDWCKEDPELLFSCGKDCRTLAWNPSTGEMVGELPATTNWAFDVASCPRNPSFVAVASFDGKISVSSLQNTSAPAQASTGQQPISSDNAADIFSAGNLSTLAAQVHPGVSLRQPPRWLKRPVSSSFGFGSKLATVGPTMTPQINAQTGQPMPVPRPVHVHQVVTDSDIVDRAVKLDHAIDSQSLSDFCSQKLTVANQHGQDASSEASIESWRLLSSLFQANSRDELVSLLNFSKAEVQQKVATAIRSFKGTSGQAEGLGNGKTSSSESGDADDAGSIAREPLVTFADQHASSDNAARSSEGEGAAATRAVQGNEATPSETEASVSLTSDATKVADSEVTEPSLFGDDGALNQNAQQQAAADFYSSLGSGTQSDRPATLSDRFGLSQQGMERAGSSVAATAGSRPSSVASDSIKASTFRIYPKDESEADKLLTRALVLGDFESAVTLCISADRFADALLLSAQGGPELLAKTQKAYFEKRTGTLPFLRLFQSIISNDLTDIVQNADLKDWQEIFVVLCTFAKNEEYPTLVEQLGQRLEYQYAVSKTTGSDAAAGLSQRKSAVLCYLAAGKLEKVVNIWNDELKEEERAVEKSMGASPNSSAARFTSHARALQSFIEKVTVFISAKAYVDTDLAHSASSFDQGASHGSQSYKLAPLYDRYHEYAELLASQGLVSLAVRYASLTPSDYQSPGSGVSARDRLQTSTGKAFKAPSKISQQSQQPNVVSAAVPAYQAVQPAMVPFASTSYYPVTAPIIPQQAQQQPQVAYDDPYRPAASASQPQQAPYGQTLGPYPSQNGYGQAPNGFATNGYGQTSYGQQTIGGNLPYQPIQQAPPPPQPVQPPPPKKPVGGWNDAPIIKRPSSTANAAAKASAAPIYSPFPNASPTTPNAYGGPPASFQGPPPAGGTGNAVPPPPPSRGTTRTPAQQMQQQPFVSPPQARGQASGPAPGPPGHMQQNTVYGQGPAGMQPRPGSRGPVPIGMQSQQGPPAGRYGPPPGQGQMQGPGQGQQMQNGPPRTVQQQQGPPYSNSQMQGHPQQQYQQPQQPQQQLPMVPPPPPPSRR